jgi:hypothetical protein
MLFLGLKEEEQNLNLKSLIIMATLQQSASGKKDGDIRYLTPLNIETNKQKKILSFQKIRN